MSNLLELAQKKFDNLTPAEQELLKKAPLGKPADRRTGVEEEDNPTNAESWDDNRVIRAELIEWLCTNPEASALVHRKGINIVGARIKGEWTSYSPTSLFRSPPWPAQLRRQSA